MSGTKREIYPRGNSNGDARIEPVMVDELLQRKPLFRERKAAVNPYRILFLIVLILASLQIWRGVQQGAIKPAFYPTPTPTRSAGSYIEEAEAYFLAGKIYDPDLSLIHI